MINIERRWRHKSDGPDTIHYSVSPGPNGRQAAALDRPVTARQQDAFADVIAETAPFAPIATHALGHPGQKACTAR